MHFRYLNDIGGLDDKPFDSSSSNKRGHFPAVVTSEGDQLSAPMDQLLSLGHIALQQQVFKSRQVTRFLLVAKSVRWSLRQTEQSLD